MLVNEVLEAVYADVLFPPPFCVDKFDTVETAEVPEPAVELVDLQVEDVLP